MLRSTLNSVLLTSKIDIFSFVSEIWVDAWTVVCAGDLEDLSTGAWTDGLEVWKRFAPTTVTARWQFHE